MSLSSYGHAYLTSYGWSGSGTGLRKGAIDKPLAIPPKKNLNGLGKDRDEAFPFWDHLFTVASKAITIKLSSDDEDTDDESKAPREGDPDADPSSSSSDPLRRTTTGILSNRRPASGTPATTASSGSTTPDPTARPASLLVIAKREAAKRGLYARFFRGPVLGPDDDVGDGPSAAASPSPSPPSDQVSGSRSELASSSVLALAPDVTERVGDRDEVGEAKKSKKRKSKDEGEETREQRRERKRLKRERKAARAAKRADRALKKQKDKDPPDRKDQKRQDEGTRSKGDGSKKARKHAQRSLPRSEGDLEPEKCTRNKSDATLAPTSRHHEASCESHSSDAVPTSKRKRKRKDTPS